MECYCFGRAQKLFSIKNLIKMINSGIFKVTCRSTISISLWHVRHFATMHIIENVCTTFGAYKPNWDFRSFCFSNLCFQYKRYFQSRGIHCIISVCEIWYLLFVWQINWFHLIWFQYKWRQWSLQTRPSAIVPQWCRRYQRYPILALFTSQNNDIPKYKWRFQIPSSPKYSYCKWYKLRPWPRRKLPSAIVPHWSRESQRDPNLLLFTSNNSDIPEYTLTWLKYWVIISMHITGGFSRSPGNVNVSETW